MTGKDACSQPNTRAKLGLFFSWFVAAALVLVTCIGFHQGFGPETATAQVPGRAVPNRQGSAQPRVANIPERATAPSQATAPTAPKQMQMLAMVNGKQISRQQLGNECIRRYGKDVLESMLNKHLIWQECQGQNIVITAQDVEVEIENMAKRFGLSVERWLTMLESERDISPDKYRRDIIWPTLALRRLAAAKIEVTRDELREAFESEYGAKVKVRMISLSTQEKADEVHKQAVADPSRFGELAKEFSEDPNSAATRGIIPPIRRHLGHEELENIAFGLKVGQVSPVIYVANQFLILKCEGHEPETYLASDQVQQKKSQLHDQIRDAKLRTAAGELFQSLQDNAQVVNIFNDPQLRQQNPGLAASVNGQQITMLQLAEECLLRHGKDVLEGEINRVVLGQELERRRIAVNQAEIDTEIARAADSYGFVLDNGAPDVEGWLKSVTESDEVTLDLYVHDAVWPSVALKLLVRDSIAVSPDDLEKGFIANYGERVEVLAIVLSNQRTASTVWEQARNNPNDQFFGELAQQYSIEPISKANYGKIPPLRRHGGQPVVEEEAFRLEAGELSGIISIGDKYIILRCLGRTKPVVRDFAAVEDELRKDIHEKKLRLAMAEEFDRLKEAAQIDNFLTKKSQPGKGAGTNIAPASFQNNVAPKPTQPARR